MVMPKTGILKRLSDFFLAHQGVDQQELKGLLYENETVVLTVPTVSCTYKPRAWMDRNSFFRATLMLTTKRVLIFKSGKKANVVRDIGLDTITRHKFSSVRSKGLKLEIKTVDADDVITFHRQYLKEFENLSEKFESIIAQSIELSAREGKTFFCMHCGDKIPTASVFCFSCGKKVKI